MGMRCLLLLLSLGSLAWARPLTRQEIASRTLENSPKLAQFTARVEQSLWHSAVLETGWNPTLSLNTSYTYVTPSVQFQVGNSSITTTVPHNYSASLSMRQLISNFGQLESESRAAQIAVGVSQLRWREQVERLMEQTYLQFEETSLHQQLLALESKALEASQLDEQWAQLRVRAGSASRYDVMLARTALAQAQQHLEEARQRYQSSLLELGLRAAIRFEPEDTLSEEVFPDLETPTSERVDEALLRRSDLQSARLAADEAVEKVEAARRSGGPNLSWQSEYSQRTATSTQAGGQWSSGLILSFPVSDGGAAEARERKARALADELQAAAREAEMEAEIELRQLALQIQSRVKELESLRQAEASASEAVRVSRLRYQNGLCTSLELLQSERHWAEARQQRLRGESAARVLQIRWQKASGSLPV